MFSYVINCVKEFLSTFAELAALPIRVFVVPGLENYGIINPIVDAVELNLVVSAVMFVFLGNLCLVNVLLKQVSNYVSRKFLKNTRIMIYYVLITISSARCLYRFTTRI